LVSDIEKDRLLGDRKTPRNGIRTVRREPRIVVVMHYRKRLFEKLLFVWDEAFTPDAEIAIPLGKKEEQLTAS
jgi:hypothetical protein